MLSVWLLSILAILSSYHMYTTKESFKQFIKSLGYLKKHKTYLIILLLVIFYIDGFIGIPNTIMYRDVDIVSNGGIGNEWSFKVYINGIRVIRYIPIFAQNGEFDVKVVAIEDDTLPDVGTTNKLYTIDDFGYKDVNVTVRETRGPGAGASAKVRFQFVIK